MKRDITKQYITAVKKEIKVSNRKKADFLNMLQENISNYMKDSSDGVEYEKLVEVFGTPQEIAEAYYASLEENELVTDRNVKKSVIRIAIIAAIAIFAVVAFTHILSYYELHRDIPVYGIETITEIEDSSNLE